MYKYILFLTKLIIVNVFNGFIYLSQPNLKKNELRNKHEAIHNVDLIYM